VRPPASSRQPTVHSHAEKSALPAPILIHRLASSLVSLEIGRSSVRLAASDHRTAWANQIARPPNDTTCELSPPTSVRALLALLDHVWYHRTTLYALDVRLGFAADAFPGWL